MKLKRILMVAAGAVFLLLFGVILNFTVENRGDRGRETDEEEAIHVLAPYKLWKQREILEDIAREYESQAGNRRVEIEFLDREDYKKEICMRMDSGENADLIICDGTVMPALIDMGVFQDISDDITVERKNSIRYQALWDGVRSNGEYYGMPFTCDPYVLFYNKDTLNERGLSLPESWEDLLELSGSIQKYSSKGFGFPAKTQDERTIFYTYLLYSMGGNYRNINKEGGIQALKTIRHLKKGKNISEDTINWTKEDLAYAFSKGQVEMMANSLSSISILRNTQTNFQPGVVCLPGEVKNSCILMGENIGLTQHADPAAIDFMCYLYQSDVMERITCAMDTLPLLQAENYQMKGIGPDEGEKLADTFLEEGYTVEPCDAWFEISATISDGVYQVLNNSEVDRTEELAREMHAKVKVSIIEK